MSSEERIAEFIRLFTAHEVRLRTFAMSLVPNWADAEEVLQQANLVLWKKFEQFRAGSNFFAWAGRIVYLEARDFRKRRAREKVRFGEEFLEAVARQAIEPEVSDELAQRERMLGECLKALKPKDRDVLRIRYEEGGSIERIAEALGKSADAIYITLSRTRKLLQNCVSRKLRAGGSA